MALIRLLEPSIRETLEIIWKGIRKRKREVRRKDIGLWEEEVRGKRTEEGLKEDDDVRREGREDGGGKRRDLGVEFEVFEGEIRTTFALPFANCDESLENWDDNDSPIRASKSKGFEQNWIASLTESLKILYINSMILGVLKHAKDLQRQNLRSTSTMELSGSFGNHSVDDKIKPRKRNSKAVVTFEKSRHFETMKKSGLDENPSLDDKIKVTRGKCLEGEFDNIESIEKGEEEKSERRDTLKKLRFESQDQIHAKLARDFIVSLEGRKTSLQKSQAVTSLEPGEANDWLDEKNKIEKSKADSFESLENSVNMQKSGREATKKSKLHGIEKITQRKFNVGTLESKNSPQNLKVATLEMKDAPQKPKVATLEKKPSLRERSKNKVFTLILKDAIMEQPQLASFFPNPDNIEIKVTVLGARLFDEILLREKVDLLSSLSLKDNQENVKSASQAEGGRGGQLFLFSFDSQLIVKSLSEEDWKALKGVQRNYCDYLGRKEESLITRIYGAFSFNFYDKRRQKSPIFSQKIMIMRNLAACPIQYISQVYDLKGSTYQRENMGKKKGKV